MNVYMKRSAGGDNFQTFIKVELSKEEQLDAIRKKLFTCKINTKSNSILTAINSITSISFSQQVNTIKNRWQAAITRTTGFVIIDLGLT